MATRNIIPRGDGEGNIGSVIKKWIKGWFVDVYVSGSITDGTDSVTVNQLANPPGGGDLLSTNNLSDVANAATSLSNLSGEPAFSKNTAFNKNFGTTAGTVLEGDTIIPTTVFTPTINSTNMVEVSQESDFGTAVGSVITLTTNTTYFVRGIVDCSNRLLANTEGISVVGWDRDKDGLNYTSSGGDFITVDNVNFEMLNLKLSSGNAVAGEVVLRAENFNYGTYNDGRLKVLTLINLQFRGCYDVHHIEGFDLVDIQNCLFWYIQATTMGCHFKNCSKLQITSCEYVRWFRESTILGTPPVTPGGYATTPLIELLANGLGNGFGAVNINGCIIHPQQTQDGINISTTSTTGFGTIASNTFINIGLTTGTVFKPEIPVVLLPDYSDASTLKYDVFANQGILNSTSGCVMTMNANTTATALTINTPTKVDTNSLAVAQAAVRYTVATDGRCTYNGSKQVYVSIHASMSYAKSGGGTEDYVFYLYKGTALVPTPVQLPGSQGLVEANKNGIAALLYGTLMNQGDFIEIWVENTSNNDNMLVSDWQVVIRE
jgi:hypothetical protein